MRRTVLDEAHVEHAVGFVDDQEVRAVETNVMLLDEIEQAAGGGHENIHALLHGVDLRILVDAAQDDGVAEVQMPAIGLQAGIDLHGQLAGRRQDERAGAARSGRTRFCARRWSSGKPNAAVLPVPVWAMPSRSRPASSAGMARVWIGVGWGVVLGGQGTQKRLGKAEGFKGRSHKKSP